MNNVKIIYYNVETIDESSFENAITQNSNTVSHYVIKPGLILLNYRGSSRNLYESLGDMIKEKSVFIHDLDSDPLCYYGFMNKEIWTWLSENRQ